ncbi:MAG TPA: hypothetical protein VHX88_05865, partial [Solirubrobacteraceae bacterium]|nr:hypothetical protein [Solirubrobacteraceae bacterium]
MLSLRTGNRRWHPPAGGHSRRDARDACGGERTGRRWNPNDNNHRVWNFYDSDGAVMATITQSENTEAKITTISLSTASGPVGTVSYNYGAHKNPFVVQGYGCTAPYTTLPDGSLGYAVVEYRGASAGGTVSSGSGIGLRAFLPVTAIP